MIHGTFMTAEKVIKDLLKMKSKAWKENSVVIKWFSISKKIVGSIYVFIVVNLTWIIFRSDSIGQSKLFLQNGIATLLGSSAGR